MSTLISGSIDLTKIDKEKLVNGKYLNIQISINDNSDQYGNNVGITIGQSKEEREAKAKKTYIGNAKVVWTNGSIKVAEKVQENAPIQAKDDLLPF
jgi:hypothetical protein